MGKLHAWVPVLTDAAMALLIFACGLLVITLCIFLWLDATATLVVCGV